MVFHIVITVLETLLKRPNTSRTRSYTSHIASLTAEILSKFRPAAKTAEEVNGKVEVETIVENDEKTQVGIPDTRQRTDWRGQQSLKWN